MALADSADIADPRVLELPDSRHLKIRRGPVCTHAAIGAGGEVAGGEQAGVRTVAEDVKAGQKRPLLFLFQPLVGRGEQLALGRDFGSVGDRERNQFGRRLVTRDQRDLTERRFHRLEQRLGIKEEYLRQGRAGDHPVANRDFARLLQALQLGLRPIDFERSDQSGSQPDSEIDQPLRPHDRGLDTDKASPRVLEREVRPADRQEDIVAGGLYVGHPRGDHPALCERLVNRVGESDAQVGPTADKERLSILAKQGRP